MAVSQNPSVFTKLSSIQDNVSMALKALKKEVSVYG